MKLWPIESYQIETPLSVPAIVARLQGITAPNRPWQRAPTSSTFVGRVTDSAFELRPVIYSATSFLPELHGSFQPHSGGTLVRVEMVPSRATLTILAALFAFLAASIFDRDTRRVLLTLAGYVLVAWIIALAGFWLDGGRARKKLSAVLSPPRRSGDTVVVSDAGVSVNGTTRAKQAGP